MTNEIKALAMPKWGLAMTEGAVTAWLVEEGATVREGDEILEIETTKITNVYESPVAGTLRRRTVEAGQTVPVGALLGVVADPGVPDADIDAFIARFQEEFAVEAAEAGEAAGPEPRFVEAGGRRLRYLVMGEGAEGAAPLVLIHGFGGDLNNWQFNQPALAEDRPVYALDLPGHGGSVKHGVEGGVPELAGAVRDFLDALGIRRAHLGGHSMGGAVALHLAAEEPSRVATVTLVCSAGLGEEVNLDYIEGFIAAERRKEMKSVLEMLFADPSLVSRDMIEELLKYKRLDGVGAALRSIADAAFAGGRQAHVLAGRLGQVTAPVQAVWGAADRIIPAAHAEAVGRRHVLDGAGHMVHMEKAGEFNRLMSDFMTSA
ncbi:acetoin dehydrogenase dihydrolipoyllysine-residue acetyltransferase subunit [Skermanella mucosa]|uniref:acetoin dehydrogenase dihydrolipoyllysine-residue acetyltransferase subunit n=1 Tax=Skermanella mucosa TaxID=1789672 RepID=UPI00192BFF67|nr:acetoin dehydrogenase dihydrolipoyllysine-residue acetyltransferase subunit [Skermanella mucosa]UEM23798.1 acetoin dehydrogenase dihydrolipoyllysine-residue acetyltransferase subunit [Skermanella mucosa]